MSLEKDNKFRETIAEFCKTASNPDPTKASEMATAQKAIALALENPLRTAVFSGDIIGDIFTKESYNYGDVPEYFTDLIRPGTEGEFTAYTMPEHGEIPRKMVSSDRFFVTTYRVANSIDCTLAYLRKANWNVVSRMAEVLEFGFKKKLNDDGFHTLISAAVSRNILGYDSDASAGQFTPRLVSLLKTIMRRNGGGNSTSVNRGKLTHLFVSPEAKDDIRAWGINLIPDAIRAQIFVSADNGSELMSVYGVEIRDIDELGVGQEYQTYYSSTLGKSLASSDEELVIGVDKAHNDSFLMPTTKDLSIETHDTTESRRKGIFCMFGDLEVGFCVADSRRTLLGSF